MWSDILVALAATLAGAISAVAGFGIGSILTPLLALTLPTMLAVAAVAIPHMVGNVIRFWTLRRQLDRMLLLTFGLASAIGALAGAALHATIDSLILTVFLGAILLFAGISAFTGWLRVVRVSKPAALFLGVASGFFGGLVGNQGGIRAAALLRFNLSRGIFVATSTAIAIVVDCARIPVYLSSESSALISVWPVILIMTAGVTAGTFIGLHLLENMPQERFRKFVAVVVIILGIILLLRPLRHEAPPVTPNSTMQRSAPAGDATSGRTSGSRAQQPQPPR